MHLLGHLFQGVRIRADKYIRIVIVEPLNPSITIVGLDSRARPAAEIAAPIGVNLDARFQIHYFRGGSPPADLGAGR